MKVLGIDPGTAILGWGVVGDESADGVEAIAYGAITTSPDMAMGDRLRVIYSQLNDLVDRYQPDYAAVEKLFFGKNAKTALAVGQARGVVLLRLAQAGIPVTELTPAEVKSAVAGYGKADKGQIERMVTYLLRLSEPPSPDDVADALAVALTAREHLRYQGALG